jgi:hypothetical protein
MFEAQTEIKNTIMVSTAEVLTEKKVEDSKHPTGILGRHRGLSLPLIIKTEVCFLL